MTAVESTSKYDSKAENKFHQKNPRLIRLKQRQKIFTVTLVKAMTPDFVIAGKCHPIYIEYKGYPRREWVEKMGHLDISERPLLKVCLASPEHIVNPSTGLTIGEWLTKHGYQWMTDGDKVPECWFKIADAELPLTHKCKKCDGGVVLGYTAGDS